MLGMAGELDQEGRVRAVAASLQPKSVHEDSTFPSRMARQTSLTTPLCSIPERRPPMSIVT
jgi:hypothetical protein